jgi:hypothetical protein
LTPKIKGEGHQAEGEAAMGYAILKGEGAIRRKIGDLFSLRTRSRRRLILGPLSDLVPFDHLPDIHNVELYSWGGDAFPDQGPLAALAERGVRIKWVNPMHLRLYWVKGKGAVIGPGFEVDACLAEGDPQDRDDLALYLDADASMVVDEVLNPLSLDPAGSDTLSDFQENCALLWRLAEGITLAVAIKDDRSPVSSGSPSIRPPQESPQTGEDLPALESKRRAFALESWLNFLGEETQKIEGLFCFYDRPRTGRVEHCCRLFLASAGFWREDLEPEVN